MGQYFRRLSLFKYTAILILGAVLSAVPVVIMMASREDGVSLIDDTPLITFIASLVMYGVWLLMLWYISLSTEERMLIRKPAPARSRRKVGFLLAALLWSLPVNVVYSLFLERFFPDFLERMMEAGNLPENLLSTSDPISLLLMFIPVVILAPIVEEIMFRGILYNLLNKYMSLPLAAVISSLVFGALHGTTFFQTAVIGFVLAVVYQVTGDLKMAMLGHAVNNGVAFLQGILLSEGYLETGSPGELILASIFLLGALVMIVRTVLYLRRNSLRSIFRDRSPMYKHEIAFHLAKEEVI